MIKDKEMKIRDALRTTYELYDEVKDFIFTTYNYEPDFFDEHIIAYLMGFDRKISTIGELKAADQWIRDNHVTVYYDKNVMSPGSSCLTVPVYPQNIKTGVFHPKVIIIYGKLKNKNKYSIHLFVSSCNLTVSGYGRNKEAFSCIEVKSKKVAESLSEFINSLDKNNEEKHSELQDFLSTIKSYNNDVEFLWTYNDRGIKLVDYMKEYSSGDLSIVSPYFDESGPKKILDLLDSRKKTTIIPAIDGEFYNIHKNNYEELKELKIKFKELINDDDSRFIHAKIIKYGNQIFVGSYNFTSAAFFGLNAEATLVFNNIENFKLNLKEISENKLLPDEAKISNRDESDFDNHHLFVSVTARWKESKLYAIAEDLIEGEKYSLRIDGLQYDIVSDLSEEQEKIITPELANHLLKHKSFTVYKNGISCFKGLINELDAGKYRPEFNCENLDESIREWFNYSEDNDNNKRNQLLINSEDEETEKVLGITQKETTDILDNYYLVAKSFENLINQIQKARPESLEKEPKVQRKTEKYWEQYSDWEEKKKKADQNLFGYLVTKPGSIENIINLLQKDHNDKKNKDIVYEWLIINYIKSAISIFPKNLVHNDVNKLYKEKLSHLYDKLIILERDINKIITNEVDKKYLGWVIEEFNKRTKNV